MKEVRGEKAQAAIVIPVLLILLALASFVIIWNVVHYTTKSNTDKVGITQFTEELEVDASSSAIGGIQVEVYRPSGEAELTKLYFIFEDVNGDTYDAEVESDLPGILGTKTYDFSYGDIGTVVEIKKVSVTPFFGEVVGIRVETDVKKVDAGLVSWWKFDGDALDNVGENDGSCVSPSCPGFINDGERGWVADFDGVDDSFEVLDDPSLNTPDEFTWSAWVRVTKTSWPQEGATIFAKPGPWQEQWFSIARSLAVPTRGMVCTYFDHFDGNTMNSVGFAGYSSNTITFNDWEMVSIIWDGSEVKIYIDGVYDSSHAYTGTIEPAGNKLIIGNCNDGSDIFKGQMDDVMIFNKALSGEDIGVIYNSQDR